MKQTFLAAATAAAISLSACDSSSTSAVTAAPNSSPTSSKTYSAAVATTTADSVALSLLAKHGGAVAQTASGGTKELKSMTAVGANIGGRVADFGAPVVGSIDTSYMYCQGSICSSQPIAGVSPDTTYDTVISYRTAADSTQYTVTGGEERTSLYVSHIRQFDTTKSSFNMIGSGANMDFSINMTMRASGYGVVNYRDNFQLNLESMSISVKWSALFSKLDTNNLNIPGNLYYLMSFTSGGNKYKAVLDVLNQNLAKLETVTGNVLNSSDLVVGTFVLTQDGGITVKDLKGNVLR
jgi:hypothetical protein